jgi:hypothetical protein
MLKNSNFVNITSSHIFGTYLLFFPTTRRFGETLGRVPLDGRTLAILYMNK